MQELFEDCILEEAVRMYTTREKKDKEKNIVLLVKQLDKLLACNTPAVSLLEVIDSTSPKKKPDAIHSSTLLGRKQKRVIARSMKTSVDFSSHHYRSPLNRRGSIEEGESASPFNGLRGTSGVSVSELNLM